MLKNIVLQFDIYQISCSCIVIDDRVDMPSSAICHLGNKIFFFLWQYLLQIVVTSILIYFIMVRNKESWKSDHEITLKELMSSIWKQLRSSSKGWIGIRLHSKNQLPMLSWTALIMIHPGGGVVFFIHNNTTETNVVIFDFWLCWGTILLTLSCHVEVIRFCLLNIETTNNSI
jgi:hypothetical protein